MLSLYFHDFENDAVKLYNHDKTVGRGMIPEVKPRKHFCNVQNNRIVDNN